MDGLSSAASAFAVASLAGQLVSGVRNLYVFWGSIQDAPGDIQAISTELRLLQIVVQDIHSAEKRHGPDKTTIDILESCLSQIKSLTAITNQLERGFRTSTSSRRTWGALKAVFKGNKVKKFQDVLRDTKITLVLVQQGGLRRTMNAYHNSYSHQLSSLTTQFTQLQLNSLPMVLETRAAQADVESHVGAMQSQVSNITSAIPNPILSVGLGRGIGRALEQTSHCPSSRVSEVDTTIEDVASNCPLDLDSQQLSSKDIVTHWSTNVMQNLFGTFYISSEVSRAGRSLHEDPEDLDEDDFIRTTSIRIHPARWLMRLGMNFGIQLALQGSVQGWKHTLNTSRAVPDDSAIFFACSDGDIDAVRELLQTAKASVWDVDTDGWTPLHIEVIQIFAAS